MNDISDWDILQDYRDNSFWSGFSSVGGLWTALNGVFSFIFGSSLLLILFGAYIYVHPDLPLLIPKVGIKPLSIFGLAHLYRREDLRQAWQDEYPLLAQERRMPNSERGLLAFLRSHLVNLDLLDDGEGQADDNQDNTSDHGDAIIPLFNRGK